MADNSEDYTVFGQETLFNELATFVKNIKVYGTVDATHIPLKYLISTEWTEKNPILLAGEVGIESDTTNFKFGDGKTPWIDLPYAGTGGGGGGGGAGSQGVQGALSNFQGVQGALSNFQGTQGLQGVGSQGLQGLSNQGVQGSLSNFQGTQGNQGRQGLQGNQGNQGLQGVQGDQGAQGLQGLQGLSHQGVQGLQGDQGSQGLQGLQGAQGLQGFQGLQGRQGTQGIQGLQGDQGTQGLQGLQGTLSNFQGTQGNQGLQGLQGRQGTQGTQGNQGLQGLQGAQGLQGVQGLQGNQGLQGAQGLQGLQGAQGLQGFQGTQGLQGLQGLQGNFGAQGRQGLQGNQGLQGLQGAQGAQGLQGIQGDQGAQGLQGLQGGGTQGSQGLQGIQGVQGSQGLQGLQGLSHQGTQGTQGLQGAQGLQGLQGLSNQGTQGTQGLQGNQGLQGVQGAQGLQGLQGRQGTQGNQGLQGDQGAQGLQGLQGLQGNQGLQGFQGVQGPQGLQGLQGRQGTQGNQGLQGDQGTQGLQGLQGLQGRQGIQGLQGDQGTQGLQGLQGRQGIQGLQGSQGPQGAQGLQGIQGIQGIQGLQGSQSAQGTQGTQGLQGLQGLQGIQGSGFNKVLNDLTSEEVKYVGFLTGSDGFISTIFASSEKLVYLPSSGSLGIGTSAITNRLTVVGTATATNYLGDGSTLVGIVTQLVSGIGIDLNPTNGKGKVTITSYKPIGKTIYVSQNGNDSNTGLAENHPKRTIKNAAGIASSGDTIKVFPGVYVEDNPVILQKTVSVEGTELRNCMITPQNSGLDLFHVNNGVHITDLSFVGPESTNGAAIVAFQPLAGVSSDRFFDGARMIRMNLDFIASEAVGYLTSTNYKNPPFVVVNSSGIATDPVNCKDDIKDILKSVCFDITRGGNSKCVGAGKSYYNGATLLHIVGTDTNGYSVKDATIDTLKYAVGIAHSCINNVGWTTNGISPYQNIFTQVKDMSMQPDGATNYSIGNCSNVLSAVASCVGVVTTIIRDGLSASGINTTYPADYDGQLGNNWSLSKIGLTTYSPGVGNITQGPYVRNCTNFIPNSVGMKVDGFHAEPGDLNDIGVTGTMSVDSYTQYNQNGIGVSITNGAYAQLVSIFTICNDIGHWTSGGGQCDITNSNSSFGNKGLVSNGVGDPESRSIYRYTGQVVNTVEFDSDNSDTIVISGLGTNRPYDGQSLYFNELYYQLQSAQVINGGSGYSSDNPPIVTLSNPEGNNGILAEVSVNVSENGSITSIDVNNNGSQYLKNPGYTISHNGGVGLAFTTTMYPIYYGIESATNPVSGTSTVILQQTLNNTVSAGSTVYFSRLSLQLATTIALEWVGSGTNINSAKPSLGGVTNQDNEFVMLNGGKIIFTGTNQSGNFRIGPDVTINQITGTISGRAFSQSLLNTVTPLIIALGI